LAEVGRFDGLGGGRVARGGGGGETRVRSGAHRKIEDIEYFYFKVSPKAGVLEFRKSIIDLCSFFER
jgi:hypothetical protein